MTASGSGDLRICVVTSIAASSEPRAPRHAIAIGKAVGNADVLFIDCVPEGLTAVEPEGLAGNPRIRRKTVRITHRRSNLLRSIISKVRERLATAVFIFTGIVLPAASSGRATGLGRVLKAEPADIYLAHNIETLLPAAQAAQKNGAKLMFDCMEFYSDMGEPQTDIQRKMVQTVEAKWLPRCALVLASSDQLADALSELYGIPRPLALYNAPPVESNLPERKPGPISLYWRNAVIGLGQRGLEDALIALRQLPDDIILNLQGRLPVDGGAALRNRIAELGIENRVVFHPPFAPHCAVREAAKYAVGLCLERKVCRNHDLTTSNKIYDYLMAGMAVVSSDLPGLRAVIERSGGGLLFQPGSPDDLARQIRTLCDDPSRVKRLSANGRAFALSEGNREVVLNRFTDAFCVAI